LLAFCQVFIKQTWYGMVWFGLHPQSTLDYAPPTYINYHHNGFCSKFLRVRCSYCQQTISIKALKAKILKQNSDAKKPFSKYCKLHNNSYNYYSNITWCFHLQKHTFPASLLDVKIRHNRTYIDKNTITKACGQHQ